MPSLFQATFPLSPVKFWKKIIQTIFPRLIIFSIILIGPIATILSRGVIPVLGSFVEIAAVVIVLWVILSVWYINSYIKSYYYSDDNGFITIRKGVFSPTEIHIQYNRIQDVYVDQDILDRFLGLFDVHIATATQVSGMEAHIDGVDAATAEGLKNFLLAQIKNSSSPQVAPVGTVPNVPVAPASPAIPMNTVAVADISSTMYPLSTTWLFAQTVGSFPFVIIFSFILSITLFAHPTRSSLAQFIINQIPYLLMNILGLELLVVGFIAVFRSNYAFSFMPDFVLYRTGYITVQERHIPYIKIQDVTISQGVVDKLFGIYTVTLENAAQQMYGRGAQNARVAIMNLTREQADAIAARIRVLMGQGGNM